MLKTPVLTISVLLCLTASALAWDEMGHMMVADIAYDHLTPTVRQKAVTLLKLNPKYHTWVKGVSAKDKDRIAFLLASTWPDDIRKDPSYTNDGTDNGNRPSGPTSVQNIGYADKLKHKYWHFIDIPFSPDDTDVVKPSDPNAMTQITLFRETLQSQTASNDVKSYDLVWLLHLVGDVHQPLHATSRFDKEQPNGDRGGNDVALCAKPCKDELHAFWDNILGTSKKPSAAIAKAKTLPPPDSQLAAISDENSWVNESYQLAQTQVYIPPIGIGAGPYTVDAAYKAAARQVASQQIALAGIRLANLLNEALK